MLFYNSLNSAHQGWEKNGIGCLMEYYTKKE